MKWPLQTPSRATGFTLVELMIAMTISMFLLAALVQIMSGSTQTFRANQGLSRIQEGGRYAMEIIGRQIRSAGYHSENVSLTLGVELNEWPLNDPSGGVFAVQGLDGAGDAPDTLQLRYYIASDCSTSSCVPTPVALDDAEVTPDTWITVELAVDADRSLVARVFDQDGNPIHQPVSAGGLPLVDGVSDMQLTFGINDDGKLRYASATSITATANWPDVVSVRVNLLLDSIDVVSALDPSLADSDGLLQRPYSATFTLRNRIQGG